MLRITTYETPDLLTFQLEGRLAGPWVQAFDDCWHSVHSRRNAPRIRTELNAVTFVDAAGKELLAAMHAHGVQLAGAGCLMRAVVEEVAGRTTTACQDLAHKADSNEGRPS
jgi:hypothetical protein